MKRKQFHITSTLGHDVIKNAWNSSIREIESLAGAMAKEHGADYDLVDDTSYTDEDGYNYVQGVRSWKNANTGVVVVFTINKL